MTQIRRLVGRYFSIALSPLVLLTCNGEPIEGTDTRRDIKQAVPASSAIATVSTVAALRGRLPIRRELTGRLRARKEVVIKSEAGGRMIVGPQEGKYYERGQALLALDDRAQQLAVSSARVALDEALYRERDLLLRIGTNLAGDDSMGITDLARENIHIQAGIPSAEAALDEAKYRTTLTKISAPFSGLVADVLVQEGSAVNAGEAVCSLIDPGSLEVEFTLLEQELADLGRGKKLFVRPIADPTLKIPATIDIINPRVEDGGLLRARARLGRADKRVKLYTGMNVRVILESESTPAVLLPKEAILERSGRSLIFTYDDMEGRAKWQYVTILAENDDRVAVSEGVEVGQLVITRGNLTLDHDVSVLIDTTETIILR